MEVKYSNTFFLTCHILWMCFTKNLLSLKLTANFFQNYSNIYKVPVMSLAIRCFKISPAFHPQNNIMRLIVLLPLFYRWRIMHLVNRETDSIPEPLTPGPWSWCHQSELILPLWLLHFSLFYHINRNVFSSMNLNVTSIKSSIIYDVVINICNTRKFTFFCFFFQDLGAVGLGKTVRRNLYLYVCIFVEKRAIIVKIATIYWNTGMFAFHMHGL